MKIQTVKRWCKALKQYLCRLSYQEIVELHSRNKLEMNYDKIEIPEKIYKCKDNYVLALYLENINSFTEVQNVRKNLWTDYVNDEIVLDELYYYQDLIASAFTHNMT